MDASSQCESIITVAMLTLSAASLACQIALSPAADRRGSSAAVFFASPLAKLTNFYLLANLLH